ncbi:MAG: DUF1631 domain-containing protein [Casimicrobiaceae bacterium]
MNTTTPTAPADAAAAAARRALPPEKVKILQGCRDMAVERLVAAFSAMLEKIGDMLMERSGRTDVREEQQVLLDARVALMRDHGALMGDFEKRLRTLVDRRIEGRDVKLEFSKLDASELSLVDHLSMDETVITSNIVRVVENSAHEELIAFNRGIGSLLDHPGLETDANPLAPATIIEAFAEALTGIKADLQAKFQILKELNQSSLVDIAAIYADLNRHLTQLGVMPAAGMRGAGGRRAGERARPPSKAEGGKGGADAAEVDVMSLFRKMASQGSFPMTGAPSLPMLDVPSAGLGGGGGMAPPFGGGMAPPSESSFMPMRPTPSGYVPGHPIISTVDLHEGLTRLQAGQTDFDIGGAQVSFAGVPEGTHNVLRDLQESPLGRKANQLESMTIEMVAMLFDFIFETRDLPDGIKAQLARLQIPVLKAAMLDGAFFAKKTHPSRLLVNALADAGLGWSPEMGNGDPLYRTIEQLVRRILNEFSDNLALFDELREELETFLADEEKAAEDNIATSADEINQNDKLQIAVVIGKAEIERRIENYPIPQFLATFLREHWQSTLEHVYLKDGDESESWTSAVTTLEDLVWSVQPKRSGEDRKHLVALLPSLLKRLGAGVHNQRWTQDQRERFMTNLVEAHAAAVKPSFAAATSPTAAVAEAAKAQAEVAKASGDSVAAAKAEALAAAMAPAMPAPPEAPMEVLDDEYLEIARNLERGMWVEFESEDGQLAFAKLAWVSPLRGTYLFTNRQGQKALSMTAEDLAHRFRADRARLVEAEPLVDRAMTSVITNLTQKIAEPADAM